MKVDFDVFCEKVTHTGRMVGARDGIEFGASVEDVKSLGLWSQAGSFRAVYDRTLPVGSMLATAHFNGEQKNDYYVARNFLSEPYRLKLGTTIS